MLEAGEAAPDFTLPGQDGEDVTLSSLRGETRVDAPGCELRRSPNQQSYVRDRLQLRAVVGTS